jgi:hypothetical protein
MNLFRGPMADNNLRPSAVELLYPWYRLSRSAVGSGGYGSVLCAVSISNKSCSDYVKGYDAGYSSTCGKNPDGCNNILTAISADPFYTSGGIDGKDAATHDFMTNSSVTTRPNQTMQNCPRTYDLH